MSRSSAPAPACPPWRFCGRFPSGWSLTTFIVWPEVDRLEELARLQNVDFTFRQEDTRHADPEPTDLLFIDTDHTRQQLEAELAAAGANVRRYLILHDTETYGEEGQDGGEGLWPAIAAFVRRNPAWCLLDHRPANHGLTVLCRTRRERG